MKSYYPVATPRFPLKGLSLLTCLAFALSLHAQVYYVKPGGAGSGASWAAAGDLQTIVNAAPAGSQVWVKAGTYYPLAYPSGSTGGSSNRDFAFTLKNGVAIYGGFAGTETLLSQRNYTTNVTILSGDVGTLGTYTDDCYHVVISVGNDNTAILDGFTIKFGYAAGGTTYITYGGVQVTRDPGAGMNIQNSQPLISNCIITNNKALRGGGLYTVNSTSPAVFTNCTFSNNQATVATSGDGGGAIGTISSGGVRLTLTGCTVNSNTSAADGGALFANNSCVLTISGCTFSSNTAAGSGGALFTMSSTICTISNSSFTSNVSGGSTSSYGGGAICSNSTGNGTTISNTTFTSNTAGYYGGAFWGNSGANGAIMTSCVFTSNQAVYGGGMACTGSAPTVNNCKFANGTATYGGGVYNNSSGTSAFSVDTFVNNKATATSGMGGGGMLNDNASNPPVSHCWFNGNTTNGADGAGQYNNNSAPTDSSCVFEANIAGGATSNGGGVYMTGSNAKFENCVFVDNSCTANGGAFYENATASTIENCTFYNNTAATGAAIYDPGGGSTKYYGLMVWNNHPDGLAVGAGAVSGWKLKYSNLQAAAPVGGSITNNTFAAPTFYNSGSYTGSDGKWATGDDGLHLASGSVGWNVVQSNYMPDDITVGPRPYPGNTYANAGAYESPGFIILPVQLLSFSATASASNTVALQWQVAVATQAVVYEVQKSANGSGFSTISTVDAISIQLAYGYTDAHAGDGTLCYRLKLTAEDG
ncbi:MAG TPA: right-handed parallel beta-helix repeat-containing protein, partial [Chitinophagaceae bacterium]|nr:right-handed parallel beta-helix repeat-containing protein [Chitinophagaceae bacterium]